MLYVLTLCRRTWYRFTHHEREQPSGQPSALSAGCECESTVLIPCNLVWYVVWDTTFDYFRLPL